MLLHIWWRAIWLGQKKIFPASRLSSLMCIVTTAACQFKRVSHLMSEKRLRFHLFRTFNVVVCLYVGWPTWCYSLFLFAGALLLLLIYLNADFSISSSWCPCASTAPKHNNEIASSSLPRRIRAICIALQYATPYYYNYSPFSLYSFFFLLLWLRLEDYPNRDVERNDDRRHTTVFNIQNT